MYVANCDLGFVTIVDAIRRPLINIAFLAKQKYYKELRRSEQMCFIFGFDHHTRLCCAGAKWSQQKYSQNCNACKSEFRLKS